MSSGSSRARSSKKLERRILGQDRTLALDDAVSTPLMRTILVLPWRENATTALVGLAEPLTAGERAQLMVVVLRGPETDVTASTDALHRLRTATEERGVAVRVAAFTSPDRGADALRLVAEQDVALLLIDAPDPVLSTGGLGAQLSTVLAEAVCDVALVAGVDRGPAPGGGPVLVPFGGHEHDWAAVELGGWIAQATASPLRLLGTRGDVRAGRRDASRLLGNASLALQRGLGIAAEPELVAPGSDGIVEAAAGAAAVVVGLSARWPHEGLGATRVAIARDAPCPVLFARRGLRPGVIAPAHALTRFTWSTA